MISILVATMLAQPASATSTLALCRPVLARKAGGTIATISSDRSIVGANSTKITGRITVFVGMGPPAAGAASAHHLIRAEYSYRCRVSGGKVRETTLSQ